MGGTAIRIVHESGRFSEDLDFDNFGISFQEFRDLLGEVAKDMELKGFSVEFRFVEKTAFHCYIKFPHLLYWENIKQNPREKILVRIDTVNKEENFDSELCTLNKFDVYRKIITNPVDIVLAQKMITIFQRKREKGRDFYDVSYLYGKTRPNYEYIENFLKMDRKNFMEKLVNRCEGLDYDFLARDVEPYLIDPSQAERVTDFYDFIQRKASEL
jgi:predicted nucleotidyltransferase component of viral defense system